MKVMSRTFLFLFTRSLVDGRDGIQGRTSRSENLPFYPCADHFFLFLPILSLLLMLFRGLAVDSPDSSNQWFEIIV